MMPSIAGTIGPGASVAWETQTETGATIDIEGDGEPYTVDIESKVDGEAFSRIPPIDAYGVREITDTAKHTIETDQVEEVVRVIITNTGAGPITVKGALGEADADYFVEDGVNFLWANSKANHIASKHDESNKTRDLIEYGADDEGTLPADAAFEAAVDDAKPGDTILFRDGTYFIDGEHIISKPIQIEAKDATIKRTSGSGPAAFSFQGPGLTGTSSGLAAATSRGDNTISVDNASVFSVGDDVFISEQAYAVEEEFKFQFATVAAVDETDDELTIEGAMYDTIPESGVVTVVDLMSRPQVRGLELDGGVDGSSWVRFRWCDHPEFVNCDIDGYARKGLWTLDCWHPRWTNCTIKNAWSKAAGDGEGFKAKRSQGGVYQSCRHYNCRRGFDWTLASHGFNTYDCRAENFQTAGWSPGHSELVRDIRGYGLVLLSENGGSANGLEAIGNKNIEVYGAQIAASRRGLDLRSGENESLESIRFRGIDIEANATGMDAQQAIHVYDAAADIDIEATIKDPNGSFVGGNQVVLVSQADKSLDGLSLDLDLETAGVVRHVQFDLSNGQALENVRLTGRIKDDGTSKNSVIFGGDGNVENAVRDVDIDMNIQNVGWQALRVIGSELGVLQRFAYHDATVNAGNNGGAIGIDILGGFSTCEDVRITGNFIQAQGEDEIAIGEGNAENVTVVDNPGASVTIAQGASNVRNVGNGSAP